MKLTRKNSPQKIRNAMLYARYENMIYHIVHSYERCTNQPFEDLLEAAYEGFLHACRKYDPKRGTFSTCAWTYITNAINSLLSKSRQWTEYINIEDVKAEYLISSSNTEGQCFFQESIAHELGQDARNICKILFTLPDTNKPANRTRLKEQLRLSGMSWPQIWRGMRQLRQFCTN